MSLIFSLSDFNGAYMEETVHDITTNIRQRKINGGKHLKIKWTDSRKEDRIIIKNVLLN